MGLEMIETGWVSILPPVIAIALALITKEVYSSLFIGVFSGMLIYVIASKASVLSAFRYIFDMMAAKISDNSYMIIFLGILWAVVVLVSKSGGSHAYGRWAGKRLKSARSSRIATALLGVLIFIDDGFNCLTVGTVMRPITDKYKISREKLAYIIDATAAPVCIIAPISSWAVAVASEISDTGAFNAFLRTIPYNLYAILTLVMVFFVCATGFDFGPMKKAEEAVKEADTVRDEENLSDEAVKGGKVTDLVLPILVLIVCAITGMAYVGGFFSGTPFTEAIGYNPTAGLTLGAFAGLITAFSMYIPRRLMTFGEFISNIIEGIQNIVAPMLILILSWALSGVCREMIGTGIFVSNFVNDISLPLNFLPFIVFVIAALISFSMGTAWGTFGILIPIVTMICGAGEGAAVFLIPSLGATLAGSVFGDHCSPISDTTILASTGAQAAHIKHVETQIPYALVVAGVCAVGYLIAGFTTGPWLPLIVSVILLLGIFIFISKCKNGKTS